MQRFSGLTIKLLTFVAGAVLPGLVEETRENLQQMGEDRVRLVARRDQLLQEQEAA